MSLPLINNSLQENCELVLTPFRITVCGVGSYIQPVQIYKTSHGELYSWEGVAALMERFEHCRFKPECTVIQRYLMAGRLCVSHSKERYVKGLPTLAGILFASPPPIRSVPGDIIIRGDSSGEIKVCSEKSFRHTQSPGFKSIAHTIMSHHVDVSLNEIITPPTLDDVRKFFQVPYEMALPEEIFRHEAI